jgi:hypothetical protein
MNCKNGYITLSYHKGDTENSAHPFNRPTLRHPNLTPSNISITPETGQISCLIDWQRAIIQPQLLCASYPLAVENPEDELTPDSVESKLPDDFASLQIGEQVVASELYRPCLLFFGYRVIKGHFNQRRIEALRDPLLLGRQVLIDKAGW